MTKLRRWSKSKVENQNYSNALKRAFLMLENNSKLPYDAQYLMEELTGWNKLLLQVHGQELMTDDLQSKFNEGIQRLLNDEPVQYILGQAYFMGNVFQVNSSVLIPRQETEELVDQVIQDNVNSNPKNILDIGTGSGVIAITLAQHFEKSNIIASDISSDALEVAKCNAQNLNVPNIKFVESNLFSSIDNTFDIVVSNPPYISTDEMDVMDESVKKYEPDLALFGENNGLEIYQKLIPEIDHFLSEKGKLYLEYGYHQKEAIKQIFEEFQPDMKVTFFKDIGGNDRYLRAEKG
ncbi:peptide chain release factor N(5)-glutamine methyltransferase [Companilactobacillus metriopterae]|uniref:peptide chain release factor N(5)-glutamine methyltransferase n=1 Tax=Companilactobacillus metriopterae TaxID=1909267 RepID=UPI0030C81978